MIVALVDCNSFFCSCERLFRPDLKNRPVGVLSNNDGCFVSRTPELKKLGVPMGAPYFKYKEVCQKNNVAVFSSNFSLYSNLSDRVMLQLTEFSDAVDVYSVDEGFLDLSHLKPEQLDEHGKEIKQTLLKNIGIPVSVGIAPTKTLSKVANYYAKKHLQHKGVVSIGWWPKKDKEILQNTPIGEVWGVGRQSVSKMQSLDIFTAYDLREYKNTKRIQKIFGKLGLQLQQELKGVAIHSLALQVAAKKSIRYSRSFGGTVTSLEELITALSTFAQSATEKLRKQNSVVSRLGVSCRTNPFSQEFFYSNYKETKLLAPTSDTRKVNAVAIELLKQIYRPGLGYKKLGIHFTDMQNKNAFQMSLFDPSDNPQSQQFMRVLDYLNHKEGPHSLQLATSLLAPLKKRGWKPNQNKRSPRYLNGWNELPILKNHRVG